MSEDFYDEDDEYRDGSAMGTSELLSGLRKLNLRDSIKAAFADLNAAQLREWYVETFVLDPTNLRALQELGKVEILDRLSATKTWQSTEHAAIGTRLLNQIEPSGFEAPDYYEPRDWNTVSTVTEYLLRVCQPWMSIRYDPASENWYQRVQPGQWQRLSKGRHGESIAEDVIHDNLNYLRFETMDVGLMEYYSLIGVDPLRNGAKYGTGPDADDVRHNRMVASAKAFDKFVRRTGTPADIRKRLEGQRIMWLDSSTLNRVRTVTPFSNGVLALVDHVYKDTEGKAQKIKQGQLLPMDIEYMVTNANSLKWHDPKNAIPNVIELITANEVDEDWSFVELHEDELLLQCPTYWSFLTHAFPEYDERSAFLRLLGAAMYGTNLKIVAAMIGEPNAGKDTVINWLSYLMPGQVANLPFSAFTPHGDEDRGFAPLMGARVATVSGEVGEGRGSKLLAEKIKTVSSGGGTLRVAEKYEKPTTIWFDGMLFLQGNSVPTIAGGDKALYTNRLVAVEFKHPFPLQARSYEGQYRAEAGAFAQVLFLNYLRYMDKGGGMQGVNPPLSWRNFSKEFENAANVHGFIESAIVESEDPIPTSTFHAALSAMAERYGSPYKVGPNYWPKRLRALGFKVDSSRESVRRRVGQDRQWCYFLTISDEKSDGAWPNGAFEQIMRDVAVTA